MSKKITLQCDPPVKLVEMRSKISKYSPSIFFLSFMLQSMEDEKF